MGLVGTRTITHFSIVVQEEIDEACSISAVDCSAHHALRLDICLAPPLLTARLLGDWLNDGLLTLNDGVVPAADKGADETMLVPHGSSHGG